VLGPTYLAGDETPSSLAQRHPERGQQQHQRAAGGEEEEQGPPSPSGTQGSSSSRAQQGLEVPAAEQQSVQASEVSGSDSLPSQISNLPLAESSEGLELPGQHSSSGSVF
jgi:hypothetical protein